MSSQVALRNRGLIATAALLAQMCLGSVYAWSVFVKPLMASEGWSQIQVTLTFNMAMACLGIGTVIGGWWQDKVGPRIVTTFAGFIYGLGFVVAAYSIKSHWLPGVYIGYGLFSGLLAAGMALLIEMALAEPVTRLGHVYEGKLQIGMLPLWLLGAVPLAAAVLGWLGARLVSAWQLRKAA